MGKKFKKPLFIKAAQQQPYEKVKFNWKKALLLIGAGVLAYTALKVLLIYDQRYFFIVFEIAASIPILAYIIVVRGRLGKTPKPEELPTEWSDKEKQDFINDENAKKKKGKPLLYVAFPFLMAVMIAFVTEYFIPINFS